MNWIDFFTRHRVPFIDRGANVKRGEVNVRCCWCGNADPSFHLGINLETGWYSCWRNRAAHSGKSPVRLVMRLLGCSYGQAREECGLGESFVDPEGFDAVAARVMGRDLVSSSRPPPRREFVAPDPSFVPIERYEPRVRRFWDYLYGRGFDDADVPRLCADYGLMACRTGTYAQRVVIPYRLCGRLVTWTARALGAASVRYLDLPVDESVLPAKKTLYNFDCSDSGGRLLVVVEGPMDALKLDFYGRDSGVRAVALSTNSLTEEQTYMLEDAAARFDGVAVMLDNKTAAGTVDSMKMRDALSFLPGVRTVAVPAGRGDPGELTPAEVRAWARQPHTN